MTFDIFAIYDSKVEAYLTPFFMRNKGEALRSLINLVSNKDHDFCKYSEDYTLFHVGNFDDTTCDFNLFPIVEPVVKFHELKKPIGLST